MLTIGSIFEVRDNRDFFIKNHSCEKIAFWFWPTIKLNRKIITLVDIVKHHSCYLYKWLYNNNFYYTLSEDFDDYSYEEIK